MIPSLDRVTLEYKALFLEALDNLKFKTMDDLQNRLAESLPFSDRVQAVKQYGNKFQIIDDVIAELHMLE